MNYAIDKKVGFPAELVMPKHLADAGVDIKWGYDFDVSPNQIVKIDTGISIDIPYGWYAEIVPRSSNTVLELANQTGIIDSTYTGNIILKVRSKHIQENLNVFEEDRHFQMIVKPHMIHNWDQVDKIEKETTRADGGFGSTN